MRIVTKVGMIVGEGEGGLEGIAVCVKEGLNDEVIDGIGELEGFIEGSVDNVIDGEIEVGLVE